MSQITLLKTIKFKRSELNLTGNKKEKNEHTEQQKYIMTKSKNKSVAKKNKSSEKEKKMMEVIKKVEKQKQKQKEKQKQLDQTKQFNKNIDFDPFEIYPNHLESNKPILLVDLGYTTHYRFTAAKSWYGHAHPEEKEKKENDYEWFDNQEFMNNFRKRYVDSILQIVKKFKIPRHNVILAYDCSTCDNWRKKMYNNYKLTRKVARDKNGFDGTKVFADAFQNLFPSMAKNYGFKLIKHNKIEADDINAIIAKYFQNNFPGQKIYILASDKDYYQLTNDDTYVVEFSNKILNEGKNGQYELWFKIFTGDKSDNIPPIKFKKGLVRDNVTSGYDIYINADKGIADKYASNIDSFFEDLKQHPDLIRPEQLELNKKLIDFNFIPEQYQKDVIKMLKQYMG